MTVVSLFKDIQLMGAFIVLGFILREFCKPIQKLYIPTSMVAGFIALVLGQQVLNVVVIPDSFSSFSGALIGLVLTCIAFGVTLDKNRVRNYLDYTMVMISVYGVQLLVGAPLGMALRKVWPTLPEGWGIMGVFSFWGGHGTASAAGSSLEKLGSEGSLAMGMILSTIGLMSAVTVGMILVNWGIRKGYSKYTQIPAKGEDPLLNGVLPKELQRPIGHEKTTPSGINALIFQFSMVMLCMWLGTLTINSLASLNPIFAKIPSLVHGMIGAVIIRVAMYLLKIDHYIDRPSVSTISGFALDVVVISAVSTLQLSLVGEFMAPILIFSIILLAISMAFAVFFCKRLCADEWFEKACCLFGMSSGAVPTGLALVRSVDPQGKSSAPDAQGVGSTLFTPVFGTMPAILPAMVLSSFSSVLGVGAALTFIPLIFGFLVFSRKS